VDKLKAFIESLDDLLASAANTKTVTWLLHAALFTASVYVTANPDYGWIGPLLQGSGQIIHTPMAAGNGKVGK
jgi:hypothetical protein